jgi:hypothetical protein
VNGLVLIVYAIVVLLAALWLLLLSLFLGWPGFIGMVMFLVGLGFFVPSLTSAVLDRSFSKRPRAGLIGTVLLVAGIIGIVWGLIARLT